MGAYEQRILKCCNSSNDIDDTYVKLTFIDGASLHLVHYRKEVSTSWEVLLSTAPVAVRDWATAGGSEEKVTVLGEPTIGEVLRLTTRALYRRSTRSFSMAKIRDWELNVDAPQF